MHYLIATYALFSSIFIFCADSALSTPLQDTKTSTQKVLKEHKLDDSRLQVIIAKDTDEYIVNTVLRPCTNSKLSHGMMLNSLSDTKVLDISCNAYYGLMCTALRQFHDWKDEWKDEISFGTKKSDELFTQLISYLRDGFDYQVIKAMPRYYIPLIKEASQKLGFELPEECCEKILSHVDILPSCALCEVFKTEALIMLRYAFSEHSAVKGDKEGYKEYYQFPAILDALW